MVGRLEGLLKNDSFSHVIVMGGTNDLGRYSAEEIIKNLSTLYQQVSRFLFLGMKIPFRFLG